MPDETSDSLEQRRLEMDKYIPVKQQYWVRTNYRAEELAYYEFELDRLSSLSRKYVAIKFLLLCLCLPLIFIHAFFLLPFMLVLSFGGNYIGQYRGASMTYLDIAKRQLQQQKKDLDEWHMASEVDKAFLGGDTRNT